jgi:hypothetical protein
LRLNDPAFAHIAEIKALDAIVRLEYPPGSFIQHVCRDSTAIPARERVPRKEKGKAEKVTKKRGGPPKNVVKEPKARMFRAEIDRFVRRVIETERRLNEQIGARMRERDDLPRPL